MLEIFLQGIGLGLILSALAGPIFFSIIQTAMTRGIIPATVLAGGQWVSDFVWIAAAYFGLLAVGDIKEYDFAMGMAGGLMLMLFGLGLFFSKKNIDSDSQTVTGLHYSGLFAKGFLINTLNPTPILFWLSLTSSSFAQGHPSIYTATLCFSVMLVVIGTDMAKIFLAHKIKPLLKPHYLVYLRKAAGVALVAFGLMLMWKVWG